MKFTLGASASRRILEPLVVLLLLGGLVLDLVTPRGYSDWIFYVLAVVMAMRSLSPRRLMLIASVGTLFTFLGFVYSPSGGVFWGSLYSRFLGLVLMWTAVWVALRWRQKVAELRESEERYRLLFERNLAGVFRTTVDGIFLDCNDAAARILGYTSPEELRRQFAWNLFCDSAEGQSYLARLSNEGLVTNLEVRLKRRDGSPICALANATLIGPSYGRPPFIEGTFFDVTDRKHAEAELRRLNRALRTMSECRHKMAQAREESVLLREICATLVKEGGYRLAWVGFAEHDEAKSVTPAAFAGVEEGYLGTLKITWADSERGRGPTGTAIRTGRPVSARDLAKEPPFAPWRQEALRRGYASSIALPLLHEGKAFGALMVYSQVVDAFDAEEVELLSRLAHDLAYGIQALRTRAERERAEEALVKLRKAVESSGEVIFMTDREGVITFVNPEFTRTYGYTAEEVVGKATPRILKGGRVTVEQYQNLWNSILNKRVFRGNFVNKARDGSLREVENSVNPILDEAGGIVGFLAAQRDISERRLLEEQLRQAQKMEAVGQLAGGVAHDFNNLLTIINGYSDLALSRLDPADPLYADLAQIRQAGDRAASVTRQLLAFSRKQILQPQVLDLNAVLANTEKMLRRLIGEDVDLTLVCEPALGSVKADPGQIEQMVINLAVNARDAMPQGGELTLQTANVELGNSYVDFHPTAAAGRYVMLAVSDSGIGMNAETRARIFEPFFTTKEKGKGTGLGLATVYGIVKQSGGNIWVYSEPGKGTTFKIYLPRIDEVPATLTEQVTREAVRGGGETILVVEDEEGVRTLAAYILRERGYNVLESASPHDAVAISEARKEPIHLLLTDVVMPGMSGRRLAEHLTFSHRGMAVLYMSGYTDTAIVHHGVLEPGTPFLNKPFTPDALARKVREVLDAPIQQRAAS